MVRIRVFVLVPMFWLMRGLRWPSWCLAGTSAFVRRGPRLG